jgi:hypothetical protein
MEALAGVAAQAAHGQELLLGLDALGDDGQPKLAREREHTAQKRLFAFARVGHERPVDLEHVRSELLQHADPGVVRAEVVDRERDAELRQRGEVRACRLGRLEEDALGQLEPQRRGRQPGGGERSGDVGQESRLAQLARRHVHGHDGGRATEIPPGRRLAAGVPQHPAADPDDGAALLGGGDEHARREQAVLGMLPAQECLDTLDRARPQVEGGLVVEDELVVQVGPPELGEQREPSRRGSVHLGREKREFRASAPLGLVHREVGIPEQLLGA